MRISASTLAAPAKPSSPCAGPAFIPLLLLLLAGDLPRDVVKLFTKIAPQPELQFTRHQHLLLLGVGDDLQDGVGRDYGAIVDHSATACASMTIGASGPTQISPSMNPILVT